MGSDVVKVQSHVDFSMRSIQALQKEQVILLQAMNWMGAVGVSGSSSGVMGSSPATQGAIPTPPVQPPSGQLHGNSSSMSLSQSGGSSVMGHMDTDHRHQWVPKMDFPKFDDFDVRIWLDKCTAYFQLYAVPSNFWVTDASLHMVDRASHWLQHYKHSGGNYTWEHFVLAVS
jgi:hypothetical protein